MPNEKDYAKASCYYQSKSVEEVKGILQLCMSLVEKKQVSVF